MQTQTQKSLSTPIAVFVALAVICAFVCLALVACTTNTPTETPTPGAGSETGQGVVPTTDATPDLPNPASAFCEEKGYRLEIREGDGGAYGVCIFPDGSECEEWAFFRGECQPGDSLATPALTPETETDTAQAEEGWQIYRNETLGYTFHYPADAIIETADDPLKTITILGPLVEDEHWPVFYVSHPADRDDYRPPENVDLAQWLAEHNLLPPPDQQSIGETRQEDVQIAGETAVHTRFARTPQSYAYDKYFIAHAGQLYVIVILHAGDKEDWELYNHFLDSFQFNS